MNKSLLLFLFTLIFSGCSNISFNNFTISENKTTSKVKIDRDALYIRNNYLLLKKLDINSSNKNMEDKDIVVKYLTTLIYNKYSNKYSIKEIFKRNIVIFKLTLKDLYWKQKCKDLIKKRCFKELKDLKKLESYIKSPTNVDSYYYGMVIQTMNKTCYTIRAGGGECNIIHNIEDLHHLYKEQYKKCVLKNNYCKNNNLRQIKIVFNFKKEKKYNATVVYIVKYDYLNSKKVKEKYIVLKSKQLYILSLNKGKRFSDIFNKQLNFLSVKELLDINHFFKKH